jgi:mono/diheme cytochrome c family protein
MARISGHLGKLRAGALALAIAAVPLAGAWAAAGGGEAEAPLTEEQMAQGRQLFTDNSCIQCHAFADAGSQGGVGPALDNDPNLTHDFVVDRITNGSGPMPSFGWLDPADIDLLARYIVQAKK